MEVAAGNKIAETEVTSTTSCKKNNNIRQSETSVNRPSVFVCEGADSSSDSCNRARCLCASLQRFTAGRCRTTDAGGGRSKTARVITLNLLQLRTDRCSVCCCMPDVLAKRFQPYVNGRACLSQQFPTAGVRDVLPLVCCMSARLLDRRKQRLMTQTTRCNWKYLALHMQPGVWVLFLLQKDNACVDSKPADDEEGRADTALQTQAKFIAIGCWTHCKRGAKSDIFNLPVTGIRNTTARASAVTLDQLLPSRCCLQLHDMCGLSTS